MDILKLKKWNTLYILLFISTIAFGQNKKNIDKHIQTNDSLYAIAKSNKNDSISNIALQEYIKIYYRQRKWELFNKYRFEHIELTHKIKDTLARAKTLEYVGAYFRKINKTDSTNYYYTKSFLSYNNIKDSLNAGLMLVNLAIIQKNIRDYSGSEYKCRLALKYLSNKAKPRRIASVHNTLATNFSKIDEYEKAIEHHKTALKLRKKKPKDSIYIIHSLNNIGDVNISYKKYNTAIGYFKEALSYKNLVNKHPKVEATILDNLTYARFKKGEEENILNSFTKALSIGQKSGYKRVIINIHLHLAEYFKKYNNLSNAILNAEKASAIAKEIKSYEDQLRALKLLGNLNDGKTSKRFFNKHDSIRDSLEIADKKKRDSFYKIELLVDEKNILLKEKQKQVIMKNQKINILAIVSFTLLVLVILFFILKTKQKKRLSQNLELVGRELIEKKLQLQSAKNYGFNNDSEYIIALHEVLKTKYDLSEKNIEFWNVFIKDFSQNEQIEILGIKKDSLKKRRISLKQKIEKKRPIHSAFTSKIAKRIYQDEEELFKNTYSKK